PVYGGEVDGHYFEEWITSGATALRRGVSQGLSSSELITIAATWIRIARELSSDVPRTFPVLDMNPANILLPNKGGALVLDLFHRKKQNGSMTPAEFLDKLLRNYVYQRSGIAVRSQIPADVQSILKGIHAGFDRDFNVTQSFLQSALVS